MKDLRCLIVDDEPLAIDVVARYLQDLNIQNIHTCDNGIEAFQVLQGQEFDLLFLDIEMPQLTGFDLLKSIPQRPLVVITTAYRDYAVKGFEWEVLDYLVKPFSFPRFLQTMEKVIRTTQQPGDSGDKNSLFLKANQQWVRIDTVDLLYIESLRDYVRVVTTTKTFIVHQPLADISARLPDDRFIRVHRSYTISIGKVDRISQHCAHIGDKIIPISRAKRAEVYRRLGQ
jgi:two-component system, LytTR family, response regulator